MANLYGIVSHRRYQSNFPTFDLVSIFRFTSNFFNGFFSAQVCLNPKKYWIVYFSNSKCFAHSTGRVLWYYLYFEQSQNKKGEKTTICVYILKNGLSESFEKKFYRESNFIRMNFYSIELNWKVKEKMWLQCGQIQFANVFLFTASYDGGHGKDNFMVKETKLAWRKKKHRQIYPFISYFDGWGAVMATKRTSNVYALHSCKTEKCHDLRMLVNLTLPSC